MQAINCLIVEDEPLAADVLREYVGRLPSLALTGVCENALQALELLRSQKIDLILLDINLPGLNGLDFITTIKGSCHIILTTAYHRYALKGYELDVVDYLLKPIAFSRFLQAVNKVFDRTGHQSQIAAEKQHYFFNVDKTHVKVMADEILYIESLKDYIRIYTAQKKLVTKFRIGEMEKMLGSTTFLRIHKSYIVNTQKISSYSPAKVTIGTATLPIGRIYRKAAAARFNDF